MKYCFLKHAQIKSNLLILILLVFCKLDANSQVFTESNLPIIIINTDNSTPILDSPRVLGTMKIIYNGSGIQNYVTDQTNANSLNYNGRIDIEIIDS